MTDATGSRRYICLTIPEGKCIDNTGDIDYQQLYAQVVHEVCDQKAPYWFNNEQVARIQQLNQNYMEEKDMAEIVAACFRLPKDGEDAKAMNSSQLLEMIRKEYPSVKKDHSTKVHVGLAMKELGYEHTTRAHVKYYKVVPCRK